MAQTTITRGQRAINWIEKHLRWPDGPKVGQKIQLANFQKDFIYQLMDGEHQKNEIIFSIPRKAAKALALDTPILTKDGWKTMGEIEVGDYVYGSNGNPTRVNAVSDLHLNRRCWRLTFSDGSQIIAADNHLWETKHAYTPWKKSTRSTSGFGGDWKVDVVNTEQIAESLYKPRKDGGKEYNHKIKLAQAIVSPDVDLPVDPYVLGAWLGDGHSASARFTVGEKDLEALVGNLQKSFETPVSIKEYNSNVYNVSFPSSGLQSALRNLGVLDNKHIPEIYLTAGTAQRWALLQGLMDTDGTVDGKGRKYTRSSYCGNNYKLCYGVWRLARSLGLKAKINTSDANIYGRFVSEVYKVSFSASSETKIFGLDRKQSLLNDKLGSRSGIVSIVACEEVDSVPCVCISVDADDHLFLAGHGLIVTHNTTLTACLAIYFLYGPESRINAQIYSFAQALDQAQLFFDTMVRMIYMNPRLSDPRETRITPSKRKIFNVKRGCFFRSMPNEPKNLYGLNPYISFIDEVGQTRTETDKIYDAIVTAVAAQSDYRIFLMSTQAAKSNMFLSKRIDDFIKNPMPHRLLVMHSLPDDYEGDIFSEEALRIANPAWDEFVVKKTVLQIAEATRKDPDLEPAYRNYYLNQRVEVIKPFIPRSLYEAGTRTLDAIEGREVVLGLDLSRSADLTALVAAYEGETAGEINLRSYVWLAEEGIDERSEKDDTEWNKWADSGDLLTTPGNTINYRYVAEKIKEIDSICTIKKLAVDRAYFDFLIQHLLNVGFTKEWLEEKVLYHRQNIVAMSPGVKMIEKLFMEGQIKHGGHPVLRYAFQNVKLKIDNVENKTITKKADKDRIDPVAAAVMAVGTFYKYEEKEEETEFFYQGSFN